MKFNVLAKRIVFIVLLVFSAMMNAFSQNDKMVLVGGTDFEPISLDSKRIDFKNIKMKGVLGGSLNFHGCFKSDVVYYDGISISYDTLFKEVGIVKIDSLLLDSIVVDSVLYDTILVEKKIEDIKSSFLDSTCIAIVRNPIELDSLHFISDTSNNWGAVWSLLGYYNYFRYELDGLMPNSPLKLVVKYRSVLDPNTNIPNNCFSSRSSFSPFVINVNSNLESVNAPKIKLGKEGVLTLDDINANSFGEFSFDLRMLDEIFGNYSSSIEITSIDVYGSIDVKIYGPSTVVAGKKALLKTQNKINGAKYQWYRDSLAISMATYDSLSFVVSKGEIYNVYLEVTYDTVILRSNTITVQPYKDPFEDLPLVSSTNFAAIGFEHDFYSDIYAVKDFEGISTPTITIGDAFAISLDVESGAFLNSTHYAISYDSRSLDSLRFADAKGDWGVVFSFGKKTTLSKKQLLNYKVKGLKAGGKYRVVVEYCNPLNDTYLNPSSKLNKNSMLAGDPYMSDTFNMRLGISNNVNSISYLSSKLVSPVSSGCDSLVFTSNSVYTGIDDMLDFYVFAESPNSYTAVKIKSIKVYGEIAPKITGKTFECVGGKNVTFKLENIYNKCTYQWYKDGKKIDGANRITYTHTTGNEDNRDYEFYCEVISVDSVVFKSNILKFQDRICCVGDNGKPADIKLIWQDDFGTFTKKGYYWVWDYSDINNPKKVEKTTLDGWTYGLDYDIPGAEYLSDVYGEGTYSVAANVTRESYSNSSGTNWLWQAQTFYGKYPDGSGSDSYKTPNGFVPDHTESMEDAPDGYGAMLFLNCGNEPNEVIYSRVIEGLTGNEIVAKCFISTWSNSQNPVKVMIRLTDMNDPSNIVVSDVVTRYADYSHHPDVVYNVQTAWDEVFANISLSGSNPTLKFEIISVGGGYDYNMMGNDLLLDDIQIWTCTSPNVRLFFDEQRSQINSSMFGRDTISLYVDESDMIKNYYGDSARYIYQYTTENPLSFDFDKTSWKTLPGSDITGDISYVIDSESIEELNSASNVYFRVILSSSEVLKSLGLDYDYNANAVGTVYSVSNIISVSIKNPRCTSPASKISIIADKNSTEKKNDKDVFSLCYGESVTLSQKYDITPDKSTWENPDFEGYSIKWFVDEKPGDMSDADVVFNGKVASETIKYSNKKLGGNQTSVVIVAVDALYPDGECVTKDTVFIKYYESPEAELLNPIAEFEEGDGAGNVDLTLTKGTALDYKIHWWKGQDTLSGISIGDDKSKKFFENLTVENGGIYCYQLVDITTGCAGDVHNYEVKITKENTSNGLYLADEDIVNVYSASGVLIKSNVKRSEALRGLEDGVYFVGGEKVVVKK